MNTARQSRWTAGLLTAALFALTVQVAAAQTTKMPSTLRYGSGYLDTPAASVLPHLAIQGTFSGFWSSLDATPVIDGSGAVVGSGPASDNFFGDGSIAIGLFNRLEVGASLQSLNDSNAGGDLYGFFGRFAILRPEAQGLGLAAGIRYNNAPDFDNGISYQPNRLGYPDNRVTETYTGGTEGFDSEVTLYGVGTLNLNGPSADWFPESDVSVSLGYGNGLFQEGDDPTLEWHRYADSNGWFTAGSWAIALGESSIMNLIGEWNGLDLNAGVQFDFGGIRVGGHVLGMNYNEDFSTFRSTKYGILGSVALCPTGDSFLCKPSLMERPRPDTIQLPAPAPDTIIQTRDVTPPLPTGTPANICLATGQNVSVLMTAQGDTLVGPGRVSIRTLRPGVVFAGTYADGRAWFSNDEPVTFEERSYSKSGQPVALQCANIMRVGEFQGVPLFAMRNAERPFQMVYVPVRPGVWQAYETGLNQTRGDF